MGALEDINAPVLGLVRLKEAITLPNTTEVSIPVRFIFILFTPIKQVNMDPHEIGRAFSTLMSNKVYGSKIALESHSSL